MDSTKPQTIIPQPIPGQPGRYFVPSRTHGKGHDVDVPARRCSCPATKATCWAYKLCSDIEWRQRQTLQQTHLYLIQQRTERARTIDLTQCQTCHNRPAAPGRAECGFCLMDAVFGERVS